jgi:transcriptional regulator with XRE-family HTH domain
MSRKSKSGLPSRSEERIRAGSQRGAEVIKERFAAELTRKRICEELGIHAQTLKKWEAEGVVRPKMRSIGGIPTAVFVEDDVAFGRGVLKLLRSHPGTMSLKSAAAQLRQGGS